MKPEETVEQDIQNKDEWENKIFHVTHKSGYSLLPILNEIYVYNGFNIIKLDFSKDIYDFFYVVMGIDSYTSQGNYKPPAEYDYPGKITWVDRDFDNGKQYRLKR